MSIINHLDSKLNNGDIISVFCNPVDNYGAVVGFLTAFDENYFVLKHVTKEGKYDGYVLRCKDQVFRIDEKTSYENTLMRLYKHYDEKHLDFQSNENILIEFLCFAKTNHFVIGIGARDYEASSVLGFVDNIYTEDETVSIHLINDEGHFDGYSTIAFDSIVRVSADCEKDVTLKILNTILDEQIWT